MFTGIISSIGTLTDLEDGEILKARIHCSYEFQAIAEANHFFSKTSELLVKNLDKYIKKETALY